MQGRQSKAYSDILVPHLYITETIEGYKTTSHQGSTIDCDSQEGDRYSRSGSTCQSSENSRITAKGVPEQDTR